MAASHIGDRIVKFAMRPNRLVAAVLCLTVAVPPGTFAQALSAAQSADTSDTANPLANPPPAPSPPTAADPWSINSRWTTPADAVFDRFALSHRTALFDLDRQYGDVRWAEDVIAELQGGGERA